MKAVNFLISTLNQNTTTVQEIGKAVELMEARQRQLDEAKEAAEREALNNLREERRKAAEEAKRDKGKGKQKSPPPLPPPKSPSSSDSDPKSPPPTNFPSPQRTPPRSSTATGEGSTREHIEYASEPS